MAERTQEIYEILVTTTGSNSSVQSLVKELNTANKQLRTTQQETTKVGNGLNSYNQRLSQSVKAQKQFTLGMQNAGYQVSDFFVQIAGGQGVVRAFSQQFPQLVQGLGLWGVAAATAVAAGSALWQMFGQGEESTKGASEALNNFAGALDSQIASIENIRTPLSELREEYGRYADEVGRAYEVQLNLVNQFAQNDLADAVGSIGSLFPSLDSDLEALTKLQQMQQRLEQDRTTGAATALQFAQAQESVLLAEKLLIDKYNLEATALRELATLRESLQTNVENQDFGLGFQDTLDSMQRLITEAGLWTDELEQAFLVLNSFTEKSAELEAVTNNAAIGDAFAQIGASMLASAEDAEKLRQKIEATKTELDKLSSSNALLERQIELINEGASAQEAAAQAAEEFGRAAITSRAALENWPIQVLEDTLAAFDRNVALARELSEATRSSAEEADRLAVALRNVTSVNAALSTNVEILNLQAVALRSGADAADAAATAQKQLAYAAAITQGLEENWSPEIYAERIRLLDKQFSLTKEIEAYNTATTSSSGAGGGSGVSNYSAENEELTELISTLESYRTEQESNRIELEQLTLAYEKYRDLLDPEQVELFERAQKELTATTSELEGVFNDMGTAFGSALGDFAVDAKSGEDAMKSFAKVVLEQLGKMIAQWLAFQAVTAIFGGATASGIGLSNPFSNISLGGSSAVAATSAAAVPATSSFASVASAAAVPAVSQLASRSVGGSSGSSASSGVTVNNYSSAQVYTQQDSIGNTQITIEEVRDVIASDVLRGGNNVSTAFEQTYKMSRGR